MSEKSKLFYQITFGAILIAGTIFLTVRYLMKGSPFVKIMSIGLIVAVIYLVVSFIRRHSRSDNGADNQSTKPKDDGRHYDKT